MRNNGPVGGNIFEAIYSKKDLLSIIYNRGDFHAENSDRYFEEIAELIFTDFVECFSPVCRRIIEVIDGQREIDIENDFADGVFRNPSNILGQEISKIMENEDLEIGHNDFKEFFEAGREVNIKKWFELLTSLSIHKMFFDADIENKDEAVLENIVNISTQKLTDRYREAFDLGLESKMEEISDIYELVQQRNEGPDIEMADEEVAAEGIVNFEARRVLENKRPRADEGR